MTLVGILTINLVVLNFELFKCNEQRNEYVFDIK